MGHAVTLEATDFDKVARAALAKHDQFPETDLDFYQSQCRAAAWQCMAVKVSGKRAGTMVLSIIRDPEPALVVNALACDPVDGFDPISELSEMLRPWAAQFGCETIRVWTGRKGMVKRLTDIGYSVTYSLELST